MEKISPHDGCAPLWFVSDVGRTLAGRGWGINGDGLKPCASGK